MTPRERLAAAITHRQGGELPFDMGACKASGISASLLYKLRKIHGRDEPVKVYDTYQMLGLVDDTDASMFGIDVVGIWPDFTCFGYRNTNWKEWTLPDGTPGLIGGDCELNETESGDIFLYPQGDRNAKASGHMPKDGHYFDQQTRQLEFDEDDLDALADYDEQFALYDQNTLDYFRQQAERYYNHTDLGIVVNTEVGAFGSTTQVLGPMLKAPTGVRDIGEWLMAHHLYPDYMHRIFTLQAERGIKNLEMLWNTVGEMAQVVFISGTDFGTQRGLNISRDMFREMYMPYYKKVTDWVHQNTTWKVLKHSCGAVAEIVGDFVEAGIDCLNPVQCDCDGMDPKALKAAYGDRLTFWGAGVDSQTTMNTGSLDDVEKQMRERIEIFSPGGGFVFSIVHNIQDNIELPKLERVFKVLQDYR